MTGNHAINLKYPFSAIPLKAKKRGVDESINSFFSSNRSNC